MPVFYVNLTKHCTPWSVPTVLTLANTLKLRYSNDEMLTVIPMWGAMRGFYKVVLQETPSSEDLILPLMVADSIVNLPLVPEEQFLGKRKHSSGGSPGRADGVLITLYDCTLGPLSKLDNEAFDKVLEAHGEVTRATQYQKLTGTGVLMVIDTASSSHQVLYRIEFPYRIQ